MEIDKDDPYMVRSFTKLSLTDIPEFVVRLDHVLVAAADQRRNKYRRRSNVLCARVVALSTANTLAVNNLRQSPLDSV